MMQPQLLEFSWQDYNSMNSYLGEAYQYDLEMDVRMSDWDLSSSFMTPEDSSDVSSVQYMNADGFFHLPVLSDDVPPISPLQKFSHSLEELDSFSNNQSVNDDIFRWMDCTENKIPLQQHSIEERYEGCLSSSMSPDITSAELSLVLPREDEEIDNQLTIYHLLKAYGEALQNKQNELADVISSRLKEMVGPLGLTMERLAYYLIQEEQGDYLQLESIKNYEAAFRAFYQMVPCGKFAHFTANLAILEAIPEEAETIHIIDFDLGDGIQWSSLIETIGPQKAMRLTSIKWKEDCKFSSQWKFDATKRRLLYHAESVGLKLEIAEMGMEELVNEIKKMGRQQEWLAFNCMVGLPHMGRKRSIRHVTEFLMAAKELINNSINRNNMKNILTLGNGGVSEERMRNLDGCLSKFYAMFESMEWHFASHLTNARTVMECLFLEPYMFSFSCFGNGEKSTEGSSCSHQLSRHGFEGRRFSRDNMEQAKEVVNDGSNLYGILFEGVNDNTMSLQWRGTTLVEVSTWT